MASSFHESPHAQVIGNSSAMLKRPGGWPENDPYLAFT
jgi:hypothetical protein